MRYDVIFFDIGSTLVDETEAYDHRARDTIAGSDVTFEQFNEKRIFFARQNKRGDLEAMAFFGLKEGPWHSEDEKLYPDAVEVLEYLHQKGYRLGVIANQCPGTEQRLAEKGILKYFDAVAASAELGMAKPDKAIFLKALEMLDCSPEKAVMIGDRLDNDIYPAMKLGMGTIWIKQGPSVYQQLDPSIAAPDHIIDCLSEIKSIL